MFDVLALGELLIDFTSVSTDESGYPTMAAHPGGAPANFLAAISKFGGTAALIGKVGDDTFGNLLVNTLKKAEIGTDGIAMDKNVFTTLAFVTLDENGDRTFAFSRKPGADTCLSFDEVNKKLIDGCKIFHFGTLSLTDEPSKTATIKAVEYAKSKGKLITFDPNYREPLWNNSEKAKNQMLWGLRMADVVKISLEEVEFLFGCDEKKGAEILLNEYNVQLAFVTLGKNGCYFANKNGADYVANFNKVNTVDTTGAGDIFGGSAVYGVMKTGLAPSEISKNTLYDITTFACASASLSTENYGGISSVCSYEKIKAFIELNGKN